MTQDKNIHIEHDTALVTDTGGIVCNQVCSPEWAEYIVRAVNNHYQLVEALEFYADRANYQRNHNDAICDVAQDGGFLARQALSNAKGGIDPAA